MVIVTIRQELGDPREDLKNKGLVLARIESPEGMEILVFDNKVKEIKILIIKLLIARVMNELQQPIKFYFLQTTQFSIVRITMSQFLEYKRCTTMQS